MWRSLILLGFLIHVCYACQGRTCAQCMTSGGNCAWCSDPGISNPQERCKTFDKFNGTCNGNITFPENTVAANENKTVTDGKGGKDSVQIQPQRLTVNIRPHSKVTVPLRFQAARDYPVDLYFLFDLSFTMKEHKDNLANLAEKIAEKIGNISNNYRLGFGYFQDKVILPYTNTIPALITNPCSGQPEACASPFGYRHKLNFTKDVTMFTNTVRNADVTGNIDEPEGGLDAIMQAVACEKKLGWRTASRRLLIYSSDATFHSAGDGKLAGIVRPNDGECHLDDDGEDTEELNQDYPSIGQIAYSVSEKKVFIIFAIAKSEAKDEYSKLSERIAGSSVNILEVDSNNIVEIIKNKYEEIIKAVTLKIDAPPNVTVELKSDCNRLKKKQQTNNCTGIKIGTPVDFDVEIMVTGCPSDPADRRKEITITPEGLPENMTIVLDLVCECDCEQSGKGEPDSPLCSGGNGTYQCGVCACNPGRFGQLCQCNKDDLSTSEKEQCQSNNNTVCSHRGQCECGQCQCNKGYSGQFCECHDNQCPKYRDQPCGGPLRGSCFCGDCQCLPGYNGTSCNCPISQDSCIGPDQEICSGRGSCNCGKCQCHRNSGYVGKFCDKCPTCPGVCAENRPCAECVAFGTGDLSESECLSSCGHVQKVAVIDDDSGACLVKGADGCTIKFKVVYLTEGNATVLVQEVKDCPKEIDLLPIIAGVIGGILGVGLLLLLLWKLLTTMYDGIEYARFKEEIDNPRWGQVRNPLYKEATTTFNNPNFEKSEPFKEDEFPQ